MSNVTLLVRPKRRRRQRCEFCRDLYHPPPDRALRNVCPTCYPGMLEVWRCEYHKMLASEWRDYMPVVAPLARGLADLVLKDALMSQFHAGWRLLDEDGREWVGAEIRRLAVKNRRQAMHLVPAMEAGNDLE